MDLLSTVILYFSVIFIFHINYFFNIFIRNSEVSKREKKRDYIIFVIFPMVISFFFIFIFWMKQHTKI